MRAGRDDVMMVGGHFCRIGDKPKGEQGKDMSMPRHESIGRLRMIAELWSSRCWRWRFGFLDRSALRHDGHECATWSNRGHPNN
jgi:hypothetical protein